MPSAQFTQPNSTTQDATTYKVALEAAALIHNAVAGAFNVRAGFTAGLYVFVEPGTLWTGTAIVERIQQDIPITGNIPAPTVNPRIDIIELDPLTGTAYRVQGTEAVSPVKPSITAGRVPLAYYQISVGATAITNAMIVPVRFMPWLAAARTDVTSPGLAQSSKAVVLDVNKAVSGIGNIAIGGGFSNWSTAFTGGDRFSPGSLAQDISGWLSLSNNAFYDGVWKYKGNGFATQLAQSPGGDLAVYTALNNAGGNGALITWSTRLAVTNDGTTTINGNTVRHNGNIFHGRVGGAGFPQRLPAAWNSVKDSIGTYTITHNLNNSAYSVVAMCSSGVAVMKILSKGISSFVIESFNVSAVKIDADFNFYLILD